MTSALQQLWYRNRLMIKGILVGFLILVLMIPTLFIHELVTERKGRQQEVIDEVSSKWAGSQTIQGPYLLVPYQEFIKDEKDRVTVIRHKAYFLPDDLRISGTLIPEVRYRSIYKIIVYKSDLKLQGSFPSLNLKELNIPAENILWNEVRLCLGMDDTRGIEEQLNVVWNDTTIQFNSGIPSNAITQSGVQAAVMLQGNTEKQQAFSVRLRLKGSGRLFFSPLGKETHVTMQSPWNNPAFDGNFLPVTRVVNEKGFQAQWKVLHYNRSIPQSWVDNEVNTEKAVFGINLLQGNDSYSKTIRSVKYAILFIALTFLIFFFIELLQKRSIHPFQYILVGLALCIFYTLLLSFSEYISFNWAYVIAAIATVGLVTLYTKSLFDRWKIAFIFSVCLSLLYTFIYVLIQLQDGALLFGSIGLFLILAAVMYYSRKVEWPDNASASADPLMG